MKSSVQVWILFFCVMGCSGKNADMQDDGDADVDSEVSEEYAGEDAGFEVTPPTPPEPPAPPVLTPCPEGWTEVPPENEDGVATCNPWPDGDPVTLPVLTPCPEGWREVPVTESGDVMGCDPFPEGGPHECASDEAHFLGEPGCSRIGTACPEGNWAEDLPTDSEVLYVLVDAPPGGDGTQESPFGTIEQAMDSAGEGTAIALSKGVFDEEVFLRSGVTLWGACVAETLATCTEQSETEATVMVRGTDTTVRNLRVSGNRMGIIVNGSRSVHVEDVIVQSAQIIGFQVINSGRATAKSLVVRDTRSRESDKMGGRAMQVSDGAQVEINRALFERNREVGIITGHTNTILNLTDVVIRDTQFQESDGMGGRGLNVQEGAQVEVNQTLFERNHDVGIFASTAGTILNINDTVIRDTQSRESDGKCGWGMSVRGGAQVEVNRTIFEQNHNVGISAANTGTILNLTDAVIRGTQPRESDEMGGLGMLVSEEAQVEVTRALFERNCGVGVVAAYTGTILNLSDAIIRDTQPKKSDGTGGRGLEAQGGAQVEVNRAIFEQNHDVGISATNTGTILNLTDAVIRGTQSQESDGMFGQGLNITEGAQVEVSRALFERNRGAGIATGHVDTILNLTDVVIRDTQSQESDATLGMGMEVSTGAQVEVTRALFERNRVTGFSASGTGTILKVTDAVIRDTQPQESDGKYGRGLHIQESAQVKVTRALFERNREVGILAGYPDTILNLTDVVIRDTQARESDGLFGRGMEVSGGAKVEVTKCSRPPNLAAFDPRKETTGIEA